MVCLEDISLIHTHKLCVGVHMSCFNVHMSCFNVLLQFRHLHKHLLRVVIHL